MAVTLLSTPPGGNVGYLGTNHIRRANWETIQHFEPPNIIEFWLCNRSNLGNIESGKADYPRENYPHMLNLTFFGGTESLITL
jgi:hypothetical protein